MRDISIGTSALLSEMLIEFRIFLEKPDDVNNVVANFQIRVEKARVYINECIHNEFVYKSKNLYYVHSNEWKMVEANTYT